jgi:uncharacterized protein (TIGR02646 family)
VIRASRPAEPAILSVGRVGWTESWVRRCAGGAWFWPSVDGAPLNQHLLPALRAMTSAHCAYCDGFPPQAATIDHFRPKAAGAFPDLAFAWENLYPCCHGCQKRGDAWDPALLAPDEPDYAFDRYFLYDGTTGRLEPHPAATPDDRHRARVTIDSFRLNDADRVELRLVTPEYANVAIELRPFRYIAA